MFLTDSQTIRKYYKLITGTTPNATLVGNLTVSDGVVSGFSTTKYVLSSFFVPQSYSWEIFCKFTTASDVSTLQGLIAGGGTNSRLGFSVMSAKIAYAISSNNSSWNVVNASGATTILGNTTYYIRAVFTGTAYNFYISTDGTNWTLDLSVTSSTKIYGSGSYYPFGLGANKYSSTQVNIPFNGSIDLKETGFKIDGQLCWTGTYREVVESTSEDYDWYRDIYTCKSATA